MRSRALAIRQRDYVVLTALYGRPARRRMWRHVLPNAMAPAIVRLTLIAGTSLPAQTGLSFLGIGLQPPLPSWGMSLAESFRFYSCQRDSHDRARSYGRSDGSLPLSRR